ncbi:MAG: hypothetical protein JWP75_283 [Frondihabitans sp.]|nr:hypothetical protein [Frondihabitans sp.]
MSDVISAHDARAVSIQLEAVDAAEVASGAPRAGFTEVFEGPGGTSVGVWEMTVGASRDVEEDEVFIVLSGSATIEIDGEQPVEIGPGSLVRLTAGSRTTWTVHATLRKVYVTAG